MKHSKIERVKEMQKLFNEVNPETEQLFLMLENLKNTGRKISELKAFYTNEWIDLYDNLPEKIVAYLEIMNQDSLWNLLQDYDILLKKILKETVAQIDVD